MRSFLAIGLPEETVTALARLQSDLPVGRAVPEDNLHLTLAFLDDRDAGELQDLNAGLQMLRARSFDLALSGLGCFGGRAPKLLFAAARPDPGLLALRRQIVTACRDAGIALPRERYRPHVTLARFGKGLRRADAERLARYLAARAGFAVPPFPVTGFSLFRSILRPDGARHEELARYPLI